MAFHFTCPYCFKKTLVDDAMVGQNGPCAGCGKAVTIPGAPAKHAEAMHPIDSQYVNVATERPEMRYAAWILKAFGAVIVMGVLAAVSIYLLWPTFLGLQQRRNKVACMNNLQQIARALNAYATEHGTYPPPVVYDSAGKAMHSWRVLILEHLGEPGLYARYDFTQPWDSKENVNLWIECPHVFISPASDDPYGSESTYVLITGNGTVFPKSGPLSPADISDGSGRTLLVVESENTINAWTKPVDIDVRKLNRRIGANGPNTLGGDHEGGATAVFADGTPAWLPEDLDPVLIDAIISPDAGEPIDPEDYQL